MNKEIKFKLNIDNVEPLHQIGFYENSITAKDDEPIDVYDEDDLCFNAIKTINGNLAITLENSSDGLIIEAYHFNKAIDSLGQEFHDVINYYNIEEMMKMDIIKDVVKELIDKKIIVRVK